MTSPPLKGVVRFIDPQNGCNLIWDDRYFPIMVSITQGMPTLAVMEVIYSNRNDLCTYAKGRGMKTIHIADVSQAGSPDAMTRKKITELGKVSDQPFLDTHLATVLVVTNPLIRGVIAAVSWLAGDAVVPNISMPSFDSALKKVDELYRKEGRETPAFPADYQVPSPD